MNLPKIVSHDEWLVARNGTPAARDARSSSTTSATSRTYTPATPHSSWCPAHRCPSCSRTRSGWAGPCPGTPHMAASSTTTSTLRRRVRRAGRVQLPDQPELLAMGDDGTGEGHGLSAFLRGEADVFHTYSTYARGTDLLNSTFNYLDLTALGRQEPWEEPPGRSWLPASGWWWRRHDEYEQEINDTRSRCPG